MREKGERNLPAPRTSDEVGRMGVILEIKESSRVQLHVFFFFGRNRITTREALTRTEENEPSTYARFGTFLIRMCLASLRVQWLPVAVESNKAGV